MFENEKKNITTELFEGILYPTPKIVPDPNNKSKTADSGEVWFTFNRLDLDDYAEYSGKINVRSALGITEDVLYESARNHLAELYKTEDIHLGDQIYNTTTEFKRIVIPYKVS